MIIWQNIKSYMVSIFAILFLFIANQTVFANEYGQEYRSSILQTGISVENVSLFGFEVDQNETKNRVGLKSEFGRGCDKDGKVLSNAAKQSTSVISKSVGAATKGFGTTLQTGGNTLKKSTLKALNLTKEQGNRAIHNLKDDLLIRGDFHGKIMGNGDVVHPNTGQVLGNLFDYLY